MNAIRLKLKSIRIDPADELNIELAARMTRSHNGCQRRAPPNPHQSANWMFSIAQPRTADGGKAVSVVMTTGVVSFTNAANRWRQHRSRGRIFGTSGECR